MVIKYWAKVCGIAGGAGGFTTYSLVMLVMYYLQQQNPPIIPTVYKLQSLESNKEYCLGWECSFYDEEWKLSSKNINRCSLKDLLAGFFTFYSSFDFGNVICPLIGRSIPVSDFDNPENLPDEMSLYKERVKSDANMCLRAKGKVKVQDPFELCLNITKGVTEKTYNIFKKACSVTSELCETCSETSLLKNILNIEKESIDESIKPITFNIPFKFDKNQSSPVDFYLTQWYNTASEAIFLVLKEVFKLQVKSNENWCLDTGTRIQKTESSQGVPTAPPVSEDLKYLCTSYSIVTSARKKISRLLNTAGINLTGFEREVCISNLLYRPEELPIINFHLTITSFNNFKKKPKGLQISIIDKSQCSSHTKELMHFLRHNLVFLFTRAIEFVTKLKAPSLEYEVKGLEYLVRLNLDKLSTIKMQNNPVTGLAEIYKEGRENLQSHNNSEQVNEDKNIETKNNCLIQEGLVKVEIMNDDLPTTKVKCENAIGDHFLEPKYIKSENMDTSMTESVDGTLINTDNDGQSKNTSMIHEEFVMSESQYIDPVLTHINNNFFETNVNLQIKNTITSTKVLKCENTIGDILEPKYIKSEYMDCLTTESGDSKSSNNVTHNKRSVSCSPEKEFINPFLSSIERVSLKTSLTIEKPNIGTQDDKFEKHENSSTYEINRSKNSAIDYNTDEQSLVNQDPGKFEDEDGNSPSDVRQTQHMCSESTSESIKQNGIGLQSDSKVQCSVNYQNQHKQSKKTRISSMDNICGNYCWKKNADCSEKIEPVYCDQVELSKSLEQQKRWFPRLFKNAESRILDS